MTPFTTRRRFIEITPFAGMALLAACSPKTEPAPPAPPASPANIAPPPPAPTPAPASAPTASATPAPMVNEKDAQAMALGYVDDASRADIVKFKNFVANSTCNNCALYQGKAGEASGPCPIFASKQVAAKGWCSSWVKKA
ncbi:MAG: twin-arginine translocation pathway signal protein [Comamonadaceae bacterium]|nr:MAG: twin-arginine translocation pathway signal protein [Comamonadaceae bacterium]